MTKVIYLSECDFRLLVVDFIDMYWEDTPEEERDYEHFVEYCKSQFEEILGAEDVDGIVTYRKGNAVEIWTDRDFEYLVREEISPETFADIRV